MRETAHIWCRRCERAGRVRSEGARGGPGLHFARAAGNSVPALHSCRFPRLARAGPGTPGALGGQALRGDQRVSGHSE